MSLTVNKRPIVVAAGVVVEIALDLLNFAGSALTPGMTLSLISLVAFWSCLPIGAALAAYFCRNWARFVLLVIWALGAAMFLFTTFDWPSSSDWPNTGGFFLLGGAIALGLLFSPPANRWYREKAEVLRAV